ncbi:GNAT family N-acetyltransferase [Mucilaginibacter sp.]
MTAKPTIRPVTVADIAALVKLSSSTFYDAFADSNEVKDVQHYISKVYNQANLLTEINCPESYFYFAEVHGQPAAYLKLNFGDAQSELKEATGMEIARIYVDKNFQNIGIGGQLINFAIAQAVARRCLYAWLGVWEHNVNAIRFYQRIGFNLFGQHDFLLGTDLQTDLLMRKEL